MKLISYFNKLFFNLPKEFEPIPLMSFEGVPQGIENLKAEIQEHLKLHLTIHGFSKERLDELVLTNFLSVHSYEWRLLVKWKGMYLYEFEHRYSVPILKGIE